MDEIYLKRYIPFFYQTKPKEKGKRRKDLDIDILDPYKVDEFSIDMSSSSWFDMRLLNQVFTKYEIDQRTFPLLISAQKAVSGSKILLDPETEEEKKINYLATVVLGLINASREIAPGNRQEKQQYISGISNFLTSIIQMDKSLEDDPFALSAMIDSAHFMLQELAPSQYQEYEEQLEKLEIEVEGSLLTFNLIRDTDIQMEQEVYIYDSKIGFIVNTVIIQNISELDQDFLYSLDLMFRLTQGGYKYKTEEEILEICQKTLSNIEMTEVNLTNDFFDLVAFESDITYDEIEMTSLLDNPLLELFDSDLKTNLFLLKLKNADSLLAQADFRTALKNSGTFRKKIPILKTVSFLMLQIFHEETQTERYLEIYQESWENWYDILAKAMNYSLAQIIAVGNQNLQNIYYEANRLELFFIQQFNDMSLSAKIAELASTMDYHIFLTNLSGGALSVLPHDLDDNTGSIEVSRLPTINHESSYIEYIDPKLLFKVMGERLNLESNYNSFRELHRNLEEILESVQEISQTKQQRIITIAIVIFSITELVLAFLEVFGNIFGV